MHTLAARSQSLCLHPLAYVKQNLSPARPDKLRLPSLSLLIVIVFLVSSACVTRSRSQSVLVHAAVAQSQTASRVNLNTAGARELAALPGVGKVIAERIVAHREQFGRFRRAEHLLMVRGISDRKFRELRNSISVE